MYETITLTLSNVIPLTVHALHYMRTDSCDIVDNKSIRYNLQFKKTWAEVFWDGLAIG